VNTGGAKVATAGMTVTSGGINVADGGFTQSDGVIHVTGGISVYNVGLKFDHTGLETLDSFVEVTGGLTIQNFGIGATGGVTISSSGLKTTGSVTILSDGLTIGGGGLEIAAGGLTVVADGLRATGGLTIESGGGILTGGLTVAAGSVSFANIVEPSDLRLKENVTRMSNSLHKLKQIRGVYFNWDEKARSVKGASFDGVKTEVGLLAQDLQKVLPEVVNDLQNGDYLTVQYTKVIPLLVEALRELDERAKMLDQFDNQLDLSSQSDRVDESYENDYKKLTKLEEIVSAFYSRRKILGDANESLIARVRELEGIVAFLERKSDEDVAASASLRGIETLCLQ